jgi:hypothetical protein
MPRISLMLLIAVLAAGCVDGRFHKKAFTSPDCGAVTGYTYTGIVYGDSKLVVIPISNIQPGTEWRFYLKPIIQTGDPDDYNTVNVKITGKDPADPPAPADANNWISTDGDYASAGTGRLRYITECVPPTVAVGDKFQFMVEVAEVGELDPRANVGEQ